MSSTRPGPLAERSRALFLELRSQLTQVIAQLKLDGAIAGWVDPAAMAWLLIATANGVAFHSQLDPQGAAVPEIAGQLGGLLVAASGEAG